MYLIQILLLTFVLASCGGGGGGGGGDGSSDGGTTTDGNSSRAADVKEVVNLSVTSSYNTSGVATGIFKEDDIVYVADGTKGLVILQISNTRELTEIASLELVVGAKAIDLVKLGNYLYIAAEENGLAVINVTDPVTPFVEGYYDTPDKAYFLTIEENTLYLSDRRGLVAFDVTDPAIPYEIWGLESSATSFMHSTWLDGSLYVAGYSEGVKTIAVTADTPFVESTDSVGSPLWAVAPYNVDGKDYLLLGGQTTGLLIYDVAGAEEKGEALALTNIAEPTAEDQTSYHIVTQGHFAYIADGNNGVQVVSLKDFGDPYVAGVLATNGTVRDIIIDGDDLLIADSSRGIHLAEVDILLDNDGDGFANEDDDFPEDDTEWLDSDGDGVGNNTDTDDDGDGIGDSIDDDSDNDGYSDSQDLYPFDPDFWIDSDGDGEGDNNEWLLVDNESIHAEVSGDWTDKDTGAILRGGSYVRKDSDSAGDFVRWNPIITSAGHYNIYVAWPFLSGGTNASNATYEVNIEGESSYISLDQNINMKEWNSIGSFDLPVGNESYIELTDTGEASERVLADAVLLTSWLEVDDSYETQGGYTFLGNYSPTLESKWNLRRMLLDTVDDDIVYAAMNTMDLCSIDVSDLTDPQLLNCYKSDDDGQGRSVVRKDGYLILADRYAGLRIFETLGGGDFTLVNTIPTFDKASRVTLDGDILYVGDTLEGVLTYDVSDPANPIYLNRVELGSETRDVKLYGNYAIAGNYYKGLAIVDATDPANMSLASRLQTPDRSSNGGIWDLEIKGDHLFMLVQSFGVQIVDISDPLDPIVLSEIQIPRGIDYPPYKHADEPPNGIELVNNLMIVSNGAHGVLLFDVEDIRNVKVVEYIDTPGIAGETILDGSTLFVADGQGSGLQIYDIRAYSYLYDPE